jgi:hypothetical protein
MVPTEDRRNPSATVAPLLVLQDAAPASNRLFQIRHLKHIAHNIKASQMFVGEGEIPSAGLGRKHATALANLIKACEAHPSVPVASRISTLPVEPALCCPYTVLETNLDASALQVSVVRSRCCAIREGLRSGAVFGYPVWTLGGVFWADHICSNRDAREVVLEVTNAWGGQVTVYPTRSGDGAFPEATARAQVDLQQLAVRS